MKAHVFLSVFLFMLLFSGSIAHAQTTMTDTAQHIENKTITAPPAKEEKVIRFGYSFGPDFGIHDPIADELFLTYQHNDRIYTLRHVFAGSPEINLPSQTIYETAIMYGICTTYRGLYLTASAGLGYQEDSTRGKYLYSRSDSMQVYQMNFSHSFGLALQLTATAETWRFLNLGVSFYANLNTVLIDYGLVMRWQFNIFL